MKRILSTVSVFSLALVMSAFGYSQSPKAPCCQQKAACCDQSAKPACCDGNSISAKPSGAASNTAKH